MIVLVTGASGHTGSRLAARLAEHGHTVFALTRDPAKLAALAGRVTVVSGDLNDAPDVTAAAIDAKPDAIIAVTHIRLAGRVIALARALGVTRVICMSSTRRFTKFPEETARAVIAGEAALDGSDLDYTIIRPTMIYGGDKDNNLTHLVRALKKYPVHPLPDGGRMLWQPVYTWDVVNAIIAALDKPETTARKAYTVAGPRALTYREIVTTILAGLGRRRVLLLPLPVTFVEKCCALWTRVTGRKAPLQPDQIARLREDKNFDVADTIRELGYKPTEFADGIRAKLNGTA